MVFVGSGRVLEGVCRVLWGLNGTVLSRVLVGLSTVAWAVMDIAWGLGV